LTAPDAEALARELIRKTWPDVKESVRRLNEAGWREGHEKTWQEWQEKTGAARRVRVSVSNGERAIEAEGETPAEAWHRAAEKALQEEQPMIELPTEPIPVPLRRDDRGGYRVGTSRVSLDTVVGEFEGGADPEGIARAYPTLQLADVYAVIAYYLRHKDAV